MQADCRRPRASAKRRADRPPRNDNAGFCARPCNKEASQSGGEGRGRNDLANTPQLIDAQRYFSSAVVTMGSLSSLAAAERHVMDKQVHTPWRAVDADLQGEQPRHEDHQDCSDSQGASAHHAPVGATAALPGTSEQSLTGGDSLSSSLARVLFRGCVARRGAEGQRQRPGGEAGRQMHGIRTTSTLTEDPQMCESESAPSGSISSWSEDILVGRPVSPSPAVPRLDMSQIKIGTPQFRQAALEKANPLSKTRVTLALLSSRNDRSAPLLTPAPQKVSDTPECHLQSSPFDSMSRTKETIALLSARATGALVSPLCTTSSLISSRSACSTSAMSLETGPPAARGRTGARIEETPVCLSATSVYHSARIQSARRQSSDPLSLIKATVAFLTANNAGGLEPSRRSTSTPPRAQRPLPEAEASSNHRKPYSPSRRRPLQKPCSNSATPEAIPSLDMSMVNFGQPSGMMPGSLTKTKEVLKLLSARHADSLMLSRRSLSAPPYNDE
mmetsp:Transcript_690/g.1819  ORF Transcript_690/g.1819 Transcript_690/m.1819 type:complete len:502 (+) Transcript_690:59-1564(+)